MSFIKYLAYILTFSCSLRLYGSYEALSYGTLTEAVGDLSGAISELIHIDPEKKDSYWGLLTFAYKKEAIIGCGINKETDQKMEHKFSNGLVAAHQYTVTRLVIVNVDGKNVRLIRLRYFYNLILSIKNQSFNSI